jgi:hypothetical protein
MVKKKSNDEIDQWYRIMPKGLIPKYENPHYEDIKIAHPARIIIVGCSGSGKTQLALTILKRMQDTFGNITLCCANANEPLYQYLKTKLDADQLQVYEGIENVPRLEDLDDDVQHLIVVDDLCIERKQKIFEEYFIRSRKIAKGCTLLYLTQNYYAVPKMCRLNCTQVILKKLSTARDLKFVLRDFQLDITQEQALQMYQECVHDNTFLLIDVETNDDNMRYRKGFLEPFHFMSDAQTR